MAILEGTEHLHRRVYRTIAEEIAQGALPVGSRLPSERELSDRLEVSRATVRRALAELGNAGLVDSYAGRGTFVSAGPIGEAPNALQSFSEVGATRGLRATAKVLLARVRPADLDEGEALGVVAGADVFELERVRLLDGLPVSIDHSRVPLARAPSLVDLDFSEASLYEALDEAGAGPARADYTIGAIKADKRRARHLGVEPGSPLLQTTTKSYDQASRLVELGEMVYRPDRYRFRATLMRRRR
jgi:GntR family transcriptional regulator